MPHVPREDETAVIPKIVVREKMQSKYPRPVGRDTNDVAEYRDAIEAQQRAAFDHWYEKLEYL